MNAVLRRGVERYQALPVWSRVVLACCWAAFIWWLSSRPGDKGETNPLHAHIWNSGHVVVFGVLAALILLSTQGCNLVSMIVSAVIAAGYGAVDEWHQSTVPERFVDQWDVCSDSCGAVLAVCTLRWLLTGSRRAGILAIVWAGLGALSVHMAVG